MKIAFHEWAKTETHQDRVALAKKMVGDALVKHKKPYVAFSGGKDSTAMLHLVLQFDVCIMVHHWDYGIYMPRCLEKEVQDNLEKLGAGNIRLETSELYWQNPRKPVWYMVYFNEILPRYRAEGYDSVFVGLREEESLKRRRRMKANKSLSKMPEIWPLQEWTWLDVWAYIISNGLPYISAYDLYGPIVGWDRARFTTFFDPEFDKFGCSNIDGMLMWKHRHQNQDRKGNL